MTFAFLQFMLQGLSALAGFLTVILVAKPDLALLTIALGALATVSQLSDSGLGSAMSTIVGPTFQNRNNFCSKLYWFRKMRVAFLALSIVAVLPTMIYLLVNNGASTARVCILTFYFLYHVLFFCANSTICICTENIRQSAIASTR